MIPSLEAWPTKAKEAPSPHEVRLTSLDTNPVFQCLRDIQDSVNDNNNKSKDNHIKIINYKYYIYLQIVNQKYVSFH